jgi:hypothetical protein
MKYLDKDGLQSVVDKISNKFNNLYFNFSQLASVISQIKNTYIPKEIVYCDDVDTTLEPFIKTILVINGYAEDCVIHTVVMYENMRKQVAYFCMSDRIFTRFYQDMWSDWTEIPTNIKINGVSVSNSTNFLTTTFSKCTTNISTQVKEFTLNNFVLTEGSTFLVNFTKGNNFRGLCQAKVKYSGGNVTKNICLNGTTGGSYSLSTEYESTSDYKHGIMFGAGVYEFIYINDHLNFTGANYISAADGKEPYILVEPISGGAQITYTLTNNTHTVFDLVKVSTNPPRSLSVNSNGDCSFEFTTGNLDLTFTYPSVWKWSNGNVPRIKGNKKYHVSVKNNCAVIAEFAI